MHSQTDLASEINSLKLVDSHEHLLTEHEWAGDNAQLLEEIKRGSLPSWSDNRPDILQDLFLWYVSADLRVAGASKEALRRLIDPAAGDLRSRFVGIQEAWEATQFTGYGEGVRLIASEVYGLDSLSPEGLERAQARLEQLRRPGERLRLLSEVAGLDHVQVDNYEWSSRPDESGPGFFLHDLSWVSFCRGDVKVEEIKRDTGVEVSTLEDLREAQAAIFRRYAPCSIAVKTQHAYSRTLRWEQRSDSDASQALATVLAGGEVPMSARLTLGDWSWARGVELAIEHNLPFKMHTGHHGGTGSMPIDWVRAGNLCTLLAQYPEARFVLMHASYPYTDELISIAKHYPNVWVDLCWTWSIDPYSSVDFVRRFIHAVPINKLFLFGGDTIWPTAAVAYSIQARRGLRRALQAEITSGDLTEPQSIAIARRLMHDNQYACFDIEATRAAIRAQM